MTAPGAPKTAASGKIALDAGGEDFTFDTEDEAAGLCIDTDGAAREPARIVKARKAAERLNGAEEIRPLRLASAIATLRADIGAGPVGA